MQRKYLPVLELLRDEHSYVVEPAAVSGTLYSDGAIILSSAQMVTSPTLIMGGNAILLSDAQMAPVGKLTLGGSANLLSDAQLTPLTLKWWSQQNLRLVALC